MGLRGFHLSAELFYLFTYYKAIASSFFLSIALENKTYALTVFLNLLLVVSTAFFFFLPGRGVGGAGSSWMSAGQVRETVHAAKDLRTVA